MQTLPLPFTTSVFIDARDPDVEMRVDPALIASGPVAPPGTKINPKDCITGIGVSISKESSFQMTVLITDNEALTFLRSVVCCIVRSSPDRLDEVLKVMQEGIEEALKSPARLPACYEGKTDVTIEGI